MGLRIDVQCRCASGVPSSSASSRTYPVPSLSLSPTLFPVLSTLSYHCPIKLKTKPMKNKIKNGTCDFTYTPFDFDPTGCLLKERWWSTVTFMVIAGKTTCSCMDAVIGNMPRSVFKNAFSLSWWARMLQTRLAVVVACHSHNLKQNMSVQILNLCFCLLLVFF